MEHTHRSYAEAVATAIRLGDAQAAYTYARLSGRLALGPRRSLAGPARRSARQRSAARVSRQHYAELAALAAPVALDLDTHAESLMLDEGCPNG